MLDDIDRLRKSSPLFELLSHYAKLGEANRETWHNRLMQLEDIDGQGLTKLHGQLIAFGWADQNTGHVPICYRITSAGLRAIRRAKAPESEEDELAEQGLQEAA